MAESETEPLKSRRWSGFVCPDCRFVFRVPGDHDGEGIVCPSCRRMLRIPREGDATARLMVSLQKFGLAEEEPETRGEKRTRAKRKRRKKMAEVPDWDPASGQWKMRNAGRKEALKAAAVFMGSLAALVAVFYLSKKAGESDRTVPVGAAQETSGQPEIPVSVPLLLPADKEPPPADTE